MSVAEFMAETVEMRSRLTSGAWKVIESYYPGLNSNFSYYLQSMESAYSYIYEFIASNMGCSVLDVGCGVGVVVGKAGVGHG